MTIKAKILPKKNLLKPKSDGSSKRIIQFSATLFLI